MERLRQGLGIAALVVGMGGCSTLPNLSTDRIGRTPYEQFVIDVDDRNCDNLANVTMFPAGYLVECGDDYLTFAAATTLLKLQFNSDLYTDYDGDGQVDEAFINGYDYPVDDTYSQLNALYQEYLERLTKSTVQRVWEARWGTKGCE